MYDKTITVNTLEGIKTLSLKCMKEIKFPSGKKKIIEYCFAKEPIELANGYYRIIPIVPELAISKNGEIITVKDGLIYDNKFLLNGYQTILFKGRAYTIHRLLAHTWLENDDPKNKKTIDHINGNKTDNRLENLEWVIVSENNKRSYLIGLKKQQIAGKLRNIKTGEILEFKTLGDLRKFLGINAIYTTMKKKPEYVIYNGYELRIGDDNRPWYYKPGKPILPYSNRQMYEIWENGALVKLFDNKAKVWEYLKSKYPNIIPRKTFISTPIKTLMKKYPEIRTPNDKNKAYGWVKDLEKDEIVYEGELLEFIKDRNINSRNIMNRIVKRGYYIYNNRYFFARDKEYFKTVVFKNKAVRVAIVKNDKKIIANSLRKAEQLSGVHAKTIRLNLNNDREIRGYKFESA